MTTQLEKNSNEQLPINLESIREAEQRITALSPGRPWSTARFSAASVGPRFI